MIVFIDDILIYSKDEDQHAKHLRIGLQTLKDQRLFAKFKKCELWLNNVIFLEHIINRDRISVDTQKIKAIIEWPQPKIVLKFRALGDLGIITKDSLKTSQKL